MFGAAINDLIHNESTVDYKTPKAGYHQRTDHQCTVFKY